MLAASTLVGLQVRSKRTDGLIHGTRVEIDAFHPVHIAHDFGHGIHALGDSAGLPVAIGFGAAAL
jgi:hypothetical protein